MKKYVLPLSLLLNIVLVLYILLWGKAEKPNNAPPQMEKAIATDTISITDEKGMTVDTVTIVMLGNSITYVGDWQEQLNRTDVFNGGKPGWTTQQLSWVIDDFIEAHRPKLCFLKGGINDYTLGIGTDRIYQNMTMVMDSISGLGTKPIFTTTLYQRGEKERNLEIDTLNARMQAFCTEKGYDFMDLRPFLCKDGDILDEFVLEDNTHLKPNAYPEWAKAMRPFLKKYGLN